MCVSNSSESCIKTTGTPASLDSASHTQTFLISNQDYTKSMLSYQLHKKKKTRQSAARLPCPARRAARGAARYLLSGWLAAARDAQRGSAPCGCEHACEW